MSRGARFFLTCLLLFLPLATQAQYNMRKMMEEGRRTLDQGYYVVAMQIFQRVVSLKPHLYEAWYLSALSKYHLDDFLGADEDCTQAIDLNPYIADIFDLRAMSRIALERYDSAATDYTRALDIDHGNRSYWFNRAYCYYMAGDNQTALSQLNYILKRFGPCRSTRPCPCHQHRQETRSSHHRSHQQCLQAHRPKPRRMACQTFPPTSRNAIC